MLFDLVFDPNERDNLAEREDYTRIKNELADSLHNWMVETHDPLLDGPVPLPEGTFSDAPDELQPS
jgi:hypothetical protein